MFFCSWFFLNEIVDLYHKWTAKEANVPHLPINEGRHVERLDRVSVAIQMVPVNQSELHVAILETVLVVPVEL